MQTQTWQQRVTQQKLPHAVIVGGATTTEKLEWVAWMIGQVIPLTPSEIANQTHPDFFKIVPEKSIGIDDVLELQAFLAQKPIAGTYKVALLQNAERLTNAALNALLKWAEEPPPNTVIIFEAQEIANWPLTLKSRCMLLHWKGETVLLKTQFSELYTALLQAFQNQKSLYPLYKKFLELSSVQGLHLSFEVLKDALTEQLMLFSKNALTPKVGPLLQCHHRLTESLKQVQAGFTLVSTPSLYANIFEPWETSL